MNYLLQSYIKMKEPQYPTPNVRQEKVNTNESCSLKCTQTDEQNE